MGGDIHLQKKITIEAFVLAGGQSKRMGQDKGLILLKGRPMVSYILNTLQEAGIPTKIIANNPSYIMFGPPVYSDIISEKGPMGGLLTAFENTTANVILLIGCDMPLISVEVINHLLSFADREKIIAPITADNVNPLFALYPRCLQQKLEKSMVDEQLKMTHFILNNQHILVPFTDLKTTSHFSNINNPAELREMETKLSINPSRH